MVNKEFADKTLNALKSLNKEDVEAGAPLVWLHDYHLMLAANTIRNVRLYCEFFPFFDRKI